jgi:hypothetical protein
MTPHLSFCLNIIFSLSLSVYILPFLYLFLSKYHLFSISFCLHITFSLSLSVYVSSFLYLFLSIAIPTSLSFSLYISLYIPISFCVVFLLYLSLSLSLLSHYLYLFLFLSTLMLSFDHFIFPVLRQSTSVKHCYFTPMYVRLVLLLPASHHYITYSFVRSLRGFSSALSVCPLAFYPFSFSYLSRIFN